MSAISAIYNAPIIKRVYEELNVTVAIKYNGKTFTGNAQCHEDDKDFMSKKVGHAIALSRARIKALTYEHENAKVIAENKYRLYQEVLGYGYKAPSVVDPTGLFFRNVIRAVTREDKLAKALNKERENLKNYIDGQAKALVSIKRFRNKGNKS